MQWEKCMINSWKTEGKGNQYNVILIAGTYYAFINEVCFATSISLDKAKRYLEECDNNLKGGYFNG